jgi:uridine kinase
MGGRAAYRSGERKKEGGWVGGYSLFAAPHKLVLELIRQAVSEMKLLTVLGVLVSAPASAGLCATSTGSSAARPFCIGVGGATASGKSSVVEEIVRLLDAEGRVTSITQDCFYKNLLPVERDEAYRQNYNFDHPNAFDWTLQRRVMGDLRAGSDVEIPTYDFVTHSRLPSEHNTAVTAPEIVIFEGILGLHDESMRELFDLKIFVDADADVRLARRIRRDMETRGRDLSGILEQYEKFVKPATETFVTPTRNFADVILPRGLENTVAIEMLAQHINGILVQRELAAEARANGILGLPMP